MRVSPSRLRPWRLTNLSNIQLIVIAPGQAEAKVGLMPGLRRVTLCRSCHPGPSSRLPLSRLQAVTELDLYSTGAAATDLDSWLRQLAALTALRRLWLCEALGGSRCSPPALSPVRLRHGAWIH